MVEASKAPCVLVIGVDPASLDPVEWSVTPEQTVAVLAAIARGGADIEAAGYEVAMCLVALDDRLENDVTSSLKNKSWDCVLIGGGIRKPPELLATFELVVNLVHRHAPQAIIAFNERPDDLLNSIQRAICCAQKNFE